MHKKAVLTPVLLALVLAPSASAARPFLDAESGLSFQPPAGWTEVKATGASAAFKTPKPVEGSWPSLNLIVTTSATPITEQVVREGLAEVRRSVPNIQNYSEKRVRMAGADAYLLAYDGTGQGRTLHSDQLIIVKGNRVYTLTGMARSSLSARYSPLFQQVFQSVKFTR
ncbi:PsbP-related protein [Deinococcus sp.]|uniref:PsbP-related protein n=1 Tax=Deinococcus sp. TaxID=47478 RepID=UPI0025C06CEE|nr:PsbP-related protein [Deinococcus sp.]